LRKGVKRNRRGIELNGRFGSKSSSKTDISQEERNGRVNKIENVVRSLKSKLL
jgi:hypothetical protein